MMIHPKLLKQIAALVSQRRSPQLSPPGPQVCDAPKDSSEVPDRRALVADYRRLYLKWLNASIGFSPPLANPLEVEERLMALSIDLVKMGATVPSVHLSRSTEPSLPRPQRHDRRS